MFAESELLPLSALQHLAFCERQAALIHIEGQWAENRLTAEGKVLHERVDSGLGDSRGDLRIARGLPLRCSRLGLVGKADAVEFHLLPEPASGASLPGQEGHWRPLPVEYKRGKPKRERCDEIQVCAQALCLEEMLSTSIPNGCLFYWQTRRRLEVAFDHELRRATESAAARLHALVKEGRVPGAKREPKCRRCSMLNLCLPGPPSASAYLHRALATELAATPEESR